MDMELDIVCFTRTVKMSQRPIPFINKEIFGSQHIVPLDQYVQINKLPQ